MIPCSVCSRFIRTDAEGCPFCNAAFRESSSMGPMVAGVILGLTLAACGGKAEDEGTAGSTTFSEAEVTAYGGPAVDTFGEEGPPPDDDDGTSSSSDGVSSSGASSTESGSETSGSGTGSGSSGTAGSGSSGPQGTGSSTAGA